MKPLISFRLLHLISDFNITDGCPSSMDLSHLSAGERARINNPEKLKVTCFFSYSRTWYLIPWMHLHCFDARRDVVMFARHLSIMSWCQCPGNAENDNGSIMLIEGATNTDITSLPHTHWRIAWPRQPRGGQMKMWLRSYLKPRKSNRYHPWMKWIQIPYPSTESWQLPTSAPFNISRFSSVCCNLLAEYWERLSRVCSD